MRAVRDVHSDAERAQGTAAIHHTTAMNSILGFSESGGVGGGKSGVVPRPSEVYDKPGNREAVEVGMQPGSKVSRGEQSTVSSRGADEVRSNLEPNVERSTVAESSAGRPGPPSSSRGAPVSNPVETNGASPGEWSCSNGVMVFTVPPKFALIKRHVPILVNFFCVFQIDSAECVPEYVLTF